MVDGQFCGNIVINRDYSHPFWSFSGHDHQSLQYRVMMGLNTVVFSAGQTSAPPKEAAD